MKHTEESPTMGNVLLVTMYAQKVAAAAMLGIVAGAVPAETIMRV